MCVYRILLWYYTLLFLFLSFAKSSCDDNNIVVVVTERVVAFKIIRFKRNFYDVFTLLVIPTTIVHDIKIYYYDVNIILFYLSFRMRADVTYAYLHIAVAAIDTYYVHDVCKYLILGSDHETLLSATAVPHSTRCKYNATFIMHIIWHIMWLNGLCLKYNITELPWLYYYV